MQYIYDLISAVLPFSWLRPVFMKNAFLALLFAGPLFGTLGSVVVSNRMAFFSDAIGHSALTGIAIGIICGIGDPTIAMVGFSLLLGFAIITVKIKGKTSTDTIIGVFSSTAVALGIVLLSAGGNFGKYQRYLVGDILSIRPGEILLLLLCSVLLCVIWLLFYNQMLLVNLHATFAKSRGIRVFACEQLFALVTAAIVTVSIRWTGLLVINSLLVLPAAASRLISRNARQYLCWSAVISFFSGIIGLAVSYYAGSAAGATIVLVNAGIFVICLTASLIPSKLHLAVCLMLTALLMHGIPASAVQPQSTAAHTSINGYMPETVHVSTLTQAFCKGYSFSLHDGRIWMKQDGEHEWALFLDTGLPHRTGSRRLSGNEWFDPPNTVQEICADADCIYVYDDNGQIYRCYLDDTTADPAFTWFNNFGFPKKQIFKLNALVAGKRGWGMGVRRKDILWYEDIFGNQHHFGTMGLETLYYLTADGREIRFTDSGLPADFSRTILGPERGSFIARNISVSGDTLFLINDYGEMYTRLIDFDTMGSDPIFFTYSYKKTEQKYTGRDYLSNYTPWGLPNEDWYRQPQIPLTGQARLTRYICIFQNGQGNFARGLRVAGLSPDGKTGFYYKQLMDSSWQFKETPLELAEQDFLQSDGADAVRASKNEHSFSGYLLKNGSIVKDIRCSIPDAVLTSEGSCTLTITDGQESFSTLLYTLELWNSQIRYKPAFDGSTTAYFVTPSFSGQAGFVAGTDSETGSEFSALIHDMLDGTNLELYAFSAEATSSYFQLNINRQSNNYTLFMTKDNSDLMPGMYKSKLLYEQPLLQDYAGTDLLLEPGRFYTDNDTELIKHVIEVNRQYISALQDEMKMYDEFYKNARNFKWGFKTVDVLTRVTFLNKINFPKIKNVTTHLGTILATNASNLSSMTEYRTLTYPYLIRLIQRRIQSYEMLLAELKIKDSAQVDERLRNTYPDYLSDQGLKELYTGTSGAKGSRTSAELSMLTQTPVFPGYLLVLDDSCHIFIELPDCLPPLTDTPAEKQELRTAYYLLSGDEDTVAAKTTGIKKIMGRQGTMRWNGKSLRLYVEDGKKEKLLFEGS